MCKRNREGCEIFANYMNETFLLPSSSHISIVTIAAATKLRSNIVVSVGATVFGGWGRDHGDGGGVWLFGHQAPPAPSKPTMTRR